jgi:AraC family transcriptional activator of pobA
MATDMTDITPMAVGSIESPEIVFERLTATADEHVRLLSSQRYRLYVFITAGKGSIAFDGRNETLLPGTVLSIPSQAKYALQLNDRIDGIWIAVQEEFLTSRVVPSMPSMTQPHSPFWNLYYSLSVRKDMVGAANRALRKQAFSELLNAQRRLGLGCDPLVAGYMLLVLFTPSYGHFFTKPQRDEQPPVRAITGEVVLSFRRLVEKHYREHWSIEDYCKQLGVTPRHLLNACKYVTGKFPKVLIHERLMREARAELNYSNKSISEIAYTLGFESASYFSRFYKRHAGVSPREIQRGAKLH